MRRIFFQVINFTSNCWRLNLVIFRRNVLKDVVVQKINFIYLYYYRFGNFAYISLAFVASLYFTSTFRTAYTMAICFNNEKCSWISSKVQLVLFVLMIMGITALFPLKYFRLESLHENLHSQVFLSQDMNSVLVLR